MEGGGGGSRAEGGAKGTHHRGMGARALVWQLRHRQKQDTDVHYRHWQYCRISSSLLSGSGLTAVFRTVMLPRPLDICEPSWTLSRAIPFVATGGMKAVDAMGSGFWTLSEHSLRTATALPLRAMSCAGVLRGVVQRLQSPLPQGALGRRGRRDGRTVGSCTALGWDTAHDMGTTG